MIYIYVILKNNLVIKKKANENARKVVKTVRMMDSAKLNYCILWIQPWQNKRQRSVNNCRSYKSGNLKLIPSLLYKIQVLAAYLGKIIMTCSLCHLENDHQQNINDC
jgi:hypothetical protein